MSMFYDLLIAQAKKKKEPIWCEYLESDSEQRIDTKYVPTDIISDIKATYSYQEFIAYSAVFSNWISDSANCTRINLTGSPSKQVYANLNSGASSSTIIPMTVGIKYVTYLGANKWTQTDENGVTETGALNIAESKRNNTSVHLFGSATKGSKIRLYNFQVYENSTLVMNFRPCLNPDTLRPAMYDTVNKKYYYNEGTGEFKYKLSFTKLDYIESTGAQYIDTGFTQKQNIKIVTDLEFTKKTADTNWDGWYCVVGSRINDNRFNMIGNAKNAFHVAIGTDNTYGKTELNTKYHTETTVHTDSFDLSVDGTYLAWKVPVTVPINEQSLYILGTHRQEVAPGQEELSKNLSFVRLYDASLYADNILARDYIPVRMNDGQIGLWDYTEGKFYPNLGTEKLKGYLNGYQVGESLHSSGGQYIDTGFAPKELTTQGAIFQAVVAEQPRNVGVFGCYNTSIAGARFQALLLKTNNLYNIGYGSQGHDMPHQTDESLLNVAVIDGKNKKIIFNETEIDTTGTEGSLNSNNYNSYLFSVIQTGVNLMSISSIYYSWIEDNGKLVRNFIPVQKGNFTGMIDTLTMKEYPNLGSGSFIFNA